MKRAEKTKRAFRVKELQKLQKQIKGDGPSSRYYSVTILVHL